MSNTQENRLTLLGLDENERGMVFGWRNTIEFVSYQLQVKNESLLSPSTIAWLASNLQGVGQELLTPARGTRLWSIAEQLATPLHDILAQLSAGKDFLEQDNRQELPSPLQVAVQTLEHMLASLPKGVERRDLALFLGVIEWHEGDLREVDANLRTLLDTVALESCTGTELRQAVGALNQIRETCYFASTQIDRARHLIPALAPQQRRFARTLHSLIDQVQVVLPILDVSSQSLETETTLTQHMPRIRASLRNLVSLSSELGAQMDVLLLNEINIASLR